MSLAEAKRQCRIDSDLTDEDDDLTFWISAARELAEQYTRRTLTPDSTWLLTLSGWPHDNHGWGQIFLPMPPVTDLVSVQYLDRTRAVQTVDFADPATLAQHLADEPPWISPAWNTAWPLAAFGANSVSIEYRAGYPGLGSPGDASGVPKIVKQAIRLMIGHWYENREQVVVETRIVPAQIPLGWTELLDPLRILP